MIDFNLSDLKRASGGFLQGNDLRIGAVSTDSRNCRGALFIALKGERFDGHDFIEQAVKNGAVAIGTERDIRSSIPVLHCDDTLRLLGLCGLLVREQSQASLVSLTGSCGKTTVKELTAAIMSQCGSTVATQGNFNNDVGVPLTLLRLERDTRYAVIEQGASHPQDIARTCKFVRSNIALINNAGEAHIEGFGSKKGVYLGKSEILTDVFSRGGVGIVPSDSSWYESWLGDYAEERRQGRLVSFGTHEQDYVRVSDIGLSVDGISLTVTCAGEGFNVALPLIGRHNALNVAAACALALQAGIPFSKLKSGLERYRPMAGRLNVRRYRDFILIDDAYNASFNSVVAALEVLKQLKGRRIFIFGDMGELGCEAENLHRLVGKLACDSVDEMWCVGELTQKSCEECKQGKHFASRDELIAHALKVAEDGSHPCFLVKGSHAMHMDLINEALKNLGEKQ